MTSNIKHDTAYERWAAEHGRYRMPAQRSAWIKGYEAAQTHGTDARNPYPDHRTKRGSITFSRVFRRTWRTGFEFGLGERDA